MPAICVDAVTCFPTKSVWQLHGVLIPILQMRNWGSLGPTWPAPCHLCLFYHSLHSHCTLSPDCSCHELDTLLLQDLCTGCSLFLQILNGYSSPPPGLAQLTVSQWGQLTQNSTRPPLPCPSSVLFFSELYTPKPFISDKYRVWQVQGFLSVSFTAILLVLRTRQVLHKL